MRVFPRNFWPSTLMNFAADNRSFLSSFFKPTFTKTKTNKTNLSDCSVKELIDNRTRIGFLELNELKQHLYEILGAIFNGVYSSDISELSSKICLYKIHHEQYYAKYCNNQEYKKYEPKVKALVKNYLHSSSSFTFEKGLNTLPKGILNYLQEKYPQNFQIHWNEEVRSLDLNSQSMIKLNDNEIYDMVISALPLPNIRNILAKDSIFKESKPYQILESVRLKSVARINFYFDKEVLPKELQSFGFLNYPNEKEEALGMTFDSRVFPLNKNETRCSIMIGNDMVEKYEFDEKKLMNVAEKYLQKRLNIKEKANEVR